MSRQLLTPAELAQRRPVWAALSEFYLDTELEAESLRAVADVFADSSFSLADIRRINYEEVAPALWFNTCDVAGEWLGFDEAWLVERIQATRPGRFGRWWRASSWHHARVDRITGHYFAAVEQLLARR